MGVVVSKCRAGRQNGSSSSHSTYMQSYIVKPFAYLSSFIYIYAYIVDMLCIVTASHCYFKIMSCYYLKCVSSDQEYPQM